jgi:hypothetical protein
MGDIVDDDCHKTSNRLVKEPWLGVDEGYIRMGFGSKGLRGRRPFSTPVSVRE